MEDDEPKLDRRLPRFPVDCDWSNGDTAHEDAAAVAAAEVTPKYSVAIKRF